MIHLLKNSWEKDRKIIMPIIIIALAVVLKFSSIAGGKLKDYYFYFYEGMDLFEPEGSQIFELPYLWFLLHSYILFIVGRDCTDQLDVLETKLLLEKGKLKFQIMKFIFLLFKGAFSLILFLIFIFFFKETVGRFIPGIEGLVYFSEEYFPLQLYDEQVLYVTVIRDFFGILIFSAIEQILAYFVDNRISFLIVNLIMIIGIFTGIPTLLINGMMVRRYLVSMDWYFYVLVLLVLILGAFFIFYLKEKRKDYIGVFR
ncbi:hypothetical protein [Lagierella sp.]|uniref:hypothetical protein n=1 Tax=Lagierella sp. TaxID=2849657 RepID=UPI0026213AD2|nr:hypothetical protein [Lagierella sp.]